MQDLFSDALRQMLDVHCTARHVREIEAGASVSTLWQAIEASGFANALLPEAQQGAGLGLRDAFPMLLLSGSYALPAPLAHTMVLRAVFAAAEAPVPAGSITLASGTERASDGTIRCAAVPYGAVADWVVARLEEGSLLLDTSAAQRTPPGVPGSLDADLAWSRGAGESVRPEHLEDWREIGAAICAAQMAGAMEAVLRRTIDYANERVQFGKPIAKFQAIQQQLSVMAEEVFASHMAAELGCASVSHLPDRTLAAVAKARASEAAWTVASIAHAVHGAIGITEEYDLQLATRRLHEWRLAYGSESYWHGRLGHALLSSGASMVEFVQGNVFPWEDGSKNMPGGF